MLHELYGDSVGISEYCLGDEPIEVPIDSDPSEIINLTVNKLERKEDGQLFFDDAAEWNMLSKDVKSAFIQFNRSMRAPKGGGQANGGANTGCGPRNQKGKSATQGWLDKGCCC